MTWNELMFDFVTLWVTIDPLGTVPLYLSVTKNLSPEERRRAAFRAIFIACGLLGGFLFLGQYLLAALRIDLIAFQIAGGIVLFLFALTMIFDRSTVHEGSGEPGHDVAIFPLAMPSIATPGALLAVVVLTNNNTHSFLEQMWTFVVLLVVLTATLALMLLGGRLLRLIGKSGANILSRVIGMLLAAMAVQLVYNALKGELGPG